MAYSEQWNGFVAAKVQSGLGSAASGSGAFIIRTTGGQGGRVTKSPIESQEVRRDGMSTRGRHGMQKSTGPYSGELSVGSDETIIEAVMRGTWGSADLAITQADMTSITTGTHTIVAAGGSWITEGIRVGDVVELTGHSQSANNGKPLRVTGVTASTITVAETLVVEASADTTFTLTRRGKVLINPASGAMVKRYFTVEEHEYDLDASEVFSDCVWGAWSLNMSPNGMLNTERSWTGTGQMDRKTGGDAPVFTSPTLSTGEPLAVVDASIRFGDSDVIDLTSFDLSIDTQPTAPDVVGSNVSPDVFTGSMQVSMNLTALRKDLIPLGQFLDETPLSLHVLAVDPNDSTKFISIFVPNFTLGSADKSALQKAGGPRTHTLSVPAALVGIDARGGGYDATMIKFQSTGA